jgi:hypothetical protein
MLHSRHDDELPQVSLSQQNRNRRQRGKTDQRGYSHHHRTSALTFPVRHDRTHVPILVCRKMILFNDLPAAGHVNDLLTPGDFNRHFWSMTLCRGVAMT